MATTSIFSGSAIILAISIFGLTFFNKNLTLWGAILASSIIAFLSFFSLWSMLILLLATYASLIIIDQLTKKRRQQIDNNVNNKVGPRTIVQVLANGLVAILMAALYIMTGSRLFMIAYAVGIGSSFVDCIASNIGVLSRRMPRDICTWKQISTGLSGGVSALGLIASFIASALFGVIAYVCISISFYEMLIIILFSILNCIVDSILGSRIQAKYQCVICNTQTEKNTHCNAPTKHTKGFQIVDNCVVNFLSNIFVVFIFIIWFA